MDVTMLLCDSAQASNGKLYILGGGWAQLNTPDTPTPMALAVKIAVPWDEANKRHTVRAELLDVNGESITLEGSDGPLVIDGNFEVGRPPGTKPGAPLDTVMVFNFMGISLPSGGYVWIFKIDDEICARAPFRVVGAPNQPES